MYARKVEKSLAHAPATGQIHSAPYPIYECMILHFLGILYDEHMMVCMCQTTHKAFLVIPYNMFVKRAHSHSNFVNAIFLFNLDEVWMDTQIPHRSPFPLCHSFQSYGMSSRHIWDKSVSDSR